MAGNDRARRCGLCDKQVYDLTQLTALEGLRLIADTAQPCVRLYRRDDGKVQTADCGTGPRRRRRRRLKVLGASAAGVVLSGAAALAAAAWPEPALTLPHRELLVVHESRITQGMLSPPASFDEQALEAAEAEDLMRYALTDHLGPSDLTAILEDANAPRDDELAAGTTAPAPDPTEP